MSVERKVKEGSEEDKRGTGGKEREKEEGREGMREGREGETTVEGRKKEREKRRKTNVLVIWDIYTLEGTFFGPFL